MHSGRPLVAQLKMRTLCIKLSDTSAFLVPLLCLLWPTNGVHWAITMATTVPHSATTATLKPPWQWFCLHSAFFPRPVVPLQQLWSFKEGTRVVLQQLHRNRTFWVWATAERPTNFSGRSKVAALCKGGIKRHYGATSNDKVVKLTIICFQCDMVHVNTFWTALV